MNCDAPSAMFFISIVIRVAICCVAISCYIVAISMLLFVING